MNNNNSNNKIRWHYKPGLKYLKDYYNIYYYSEDFLR